MKKKIFRVLLVFFLFIFAFAVWNLWRIHNTYEKGDEEYEDLRKYTEKDPDSDLDKCPIKVNFAELAKVNPDVVGWVYVDDELSYPIVQTKDNEYYLHHTFEKTENINGAIFLDAGCTPPFYTTNSIVYGHNMNSGKMFGYLKKYYDTNYNSEADYREHEFIWIITPEREMEYRVFSAREIHVKIDTENNTVFHPAYMIEFEWDEDYEAYLKDAVKSSLYKTRTKPDPDNQIVTLSTCTSTTETGRFIVQGTLIQDTDHKE